MDSTIHELLPWYLAGTLEPRLTEEFREHLGKCEGCQAGMAFLEDLQGALEHHGEEFLEDHPTSEQLVAVVRGEVDGEEAMRVRRHMSVCRTCAEEAGWVSGGEVYGKAPGDARQVLLPKRNWRGWALGAAAAALLIVLIPLVLLSRGPGVASGHVRMNHILGPERASSAGNVVELDSGQTELSLVFEVGLPIDAFPLTVEIRDADGRSVVTEPTLAHADLLDGFLYMKCARADCAPGNYTIQIMRRGNTEPDLTFHFQVRQRRR